jgi:tRNA(Ile)-lysidine synthase
MKIDIPAGKYVVAVSGGVDSMVLLDMLRRKTGIDIVVAHFNHGIRTDSGEDEKLVAYTAKKWNIPIEVGYGNLGKNISEEHARNARYKFLNSVQFKHKADAILTAHHQDDLIETAFINILRGSGHRGLVSIKTNPNIKRPMIDFPKARIIRYANLHKIEWREDMTNENETYLRNYIRKNILPFMDEEKRASLVSSIDKIAEKIAEKDLLLATISHKVMKNEQISRSKYVLLPVEVRNELIVYWLRAMNVKEYDKKTVEKIDINLKTGAAGSRFPIKKGLWLKLNSTTAQFDSHA